MRHRNENMVVKVPTNCMQSTKVKRIIFIKLYCSL